MKKITCFVLLLAASLSTFAQTWKSDKPHSQLKFDITHMGISTISGVFTDFTATITATKADFSDAVFTLTAQSGSINTGVEMRDNHLKSPDFF